MNVIDSFSLKGKVALLTGGAGLYGRQIAAALAEAGAVTCIAARNVSALEAVAQELNDSGGDVVALPLDLASESSIETLIKTIADRYGRLDILVNNAVTRCACANWDQPMELFDESLRINASALFCITRLAANLMKKSSSGSIINIGSYMGVRGPDPQNYLGTDMMQTPSPAYFFEKGGMVNFTRFAASVLGPDNIRVNAIHPGGFFNNQHPRFVENYSANTMLGRLANETDLKGIVVFLASAASAYLTGTNIPVDGGYTAK
ncbi:MAG: SDR family oxidoreductase [Lentisphaerae bacterium]|jgi:NAD(P)-dependent dehydrogenase (short-subunit alcohol dehydrogenase family)|nr:SDR family oxidoreductase [Lentisphaerota bacterium]